jgi:hypothetical protein
VKQTVRALTRGAVGARGALDAVHGVGARRRRRTVLASLAACTGDANSRRSRVFPLRTKITDIRAVHSLMFTW